MNRHTAIGPLSGPDKVPEVFRGKTVKRELGWPKAEQNIPQLHSSKREPGRKAANAHKKRIQHEANRRDRAEKQSAANVKGKTYSKR